MCIPCKTVHTLVEIPGFAIGFDVVVKCEDILCVVLPIDQQIAKHIRHKKKNIEDS